MAKINWQDIGNLVAADQNSINKAIIIPAKEALRQVRFALNGNLTIRDNAYAAIVTLGYTGNSTQTARTGIEYTFQNPLKTLPIGFTPIAAMDANNVDIELPQCKFNTARTDGLIGITPWMFSTTGFQGERVVGFVQSANAVDMPATPGVTDVTSITLSPGTWDIDFLASIQIGTATAPTITRAWSSTVSATDPGSTANADSRMVTNIVPTAVAGVVLTLPGWRQVLSVSTVYYLSTGMTYGVGTPTTSGRISAVRSSLVGNGQTGIITGILWGG